ncbi:MAG: NAD(P)H-binding protein [Lachnospiraceae bacterium]|jgi:putative NADH-flavin reductase|nr:NAD(P)H-binding protein [Lachnospiraceae bacterium]MCH4030094.1 NAD(P)H-binding protein [Lachnospiraceae bacterium]MCH4070252.1 NAD(P)H-binding protein [Lachnospiraceae bacterium]MCH4107758.1 NAD(P)H-binding protein [Lachnospiraceae bacterium]MCI1301391.1 NAD(P)H-binding protein [Lachnospiraceae bacterium]
MKKIAVAAADGRVARKVITEAVNRGFDVTAFGRKDENITDAQHYFKKDIFDLTKEDLEGFDAVVDAFGAWTEETLPQHSTTLAHLCDVLSGTDTRLLIVGGAGSLFVNPEHTATVSEGPDFPDAFKPLASAMAAALVELRKRNDVKWTYISPAGDFQADGERSGKYILGGEELTLNAKGESIISYADYAIAMVDEIESGNHIQERSSVVRV